MAMPSLSSIARRGCLVLVSLGALDAVAAEPADPYGVTVWATATFGPDGTVNALAFSTLTKHPEGFLEKLRPVLMKARIPPPLDDGAPATFESGMRVTVRVNTGAAGDTFSVASLSLQPLPTRVYTPVHAQSNSLDKPFTLLVAASCTVGVEGRCGQISIEGDVTRYYQDAVIDAFKRWEFVPQKLNGKPTAGLARMNFAFEIK